jgi:hypothetical protein
MRMKRALFPSIAAVMIASVGCSATGGGTQAANSAAAVLTGVPTWTANIRGVAQSRFNAPDSTRVHSYGSARWTPGNSSTLSVVNVAFAYDGPEHFLSWAILFGGCGTASLPLETLSSFPEIDVSSGGRGVVNATLFIEFPESGTYHVEIYKDRRGGPRIVNRLRQSEAGPELTLVRYGTVSTTTHTPLDCC